MQEIIRKTISVCPVCREKIPADYCRRGENVYLQKTCPSHGSFEVPVWKGSLSFEDWVSGWDPMEPEKCGCPDACGLCRAHGNRTCCAVLDITSRCNLGCPVCFAVSGGGKDLPMTEVMAALEDMYERGIRYIHLSGGEPTVHPKLPNIISYARRLGYEYIQLNTNGVRLAEDPVYVRELAEAGLSSVFLQFDGTEDEIFRRIRGRDLLSVKIKAIENCGGVYLGVVLVPTLISGINTGNIGDIVRFALSRVPAVRGIHFQPVMYTGRYEEPEGGRFTLPELMTALEQQTGGILHVSDFQPSACDSPLCGLHAEYMKEPGGLRLVRSGGRAADGSGGRMRTAANNQKHVRNKWTRKRPEAWEEGSLDALLQELSDSSFGISAMAFQDRWNLDMERLRECSIHVYDRGRLIPFCVYHNLTDHNGDEQKEARRKNDN